MTPRDAITFVKSPTGAFLAFCIFLVVALFLFRGCKSDQLNSKSLIPPAKTAGADPKPQIVHTVENKVFSPLNLLQPAKQQTSAPEANPAPEQKAKPPELMPISLFAEAPTPEPKQLSRNYAPFGRLIPCELVITVDSSSIHTPIVGLILEDVYHAGRLIIPAGTEVHSTAQIDRTRERIASGNHWTLVWQSGEELTLSGIALDREKDGEGWGITDGSAGLKGRIFKSDDLAEIKLFAATFLSGAAGVLTDRENTILGSQMSPTLRKASSSLAFCHCGWGVNIWGMPPQPVYLTRTDFSSSVAARLSDSSWRTSRMAARLARAFCLSDPSPIRSAAVIR